MTRKDKKESDWQEDLEKPLAEEIIENEPVKAVAKLDPDSTERIKHGVILTGGIDSTVMLCQLKKDLPKDAEIIPITLGSRPKELTGILNEVGVITQVKNFDIDDSDADESKMLPLIGWAIENKIFVIHFAANHDEAEHSIPNRNFDYFQRLNDLSEVNISTPFITVTKEKIIQDAVDLYNIDLGQMAEPQRKQKDTKIKEAYDKIRENGFKKAFSLKYQKFIPDPFAPVPEPEKKE
jgi:hypothetical protein